MAPGLLEYPFAGVDKNDGKVGSGSSGRHVACVLLVARGIGNDELSPLRREVAIRNVDGDSLLPLGAQSVCQLREVDRRLGGSPLRVGDGPYMIFIDIPRIVEEAPD